MSIFHDILLLKQEVYQFPRNISFYANLLIFINLIPCICLAKKQFLIYNLGKLLPIEAKVCRFENESV